MKPFPLSRDRIHAGLTRAVAVAFEGTVLLPMRLAHAVTGDALWPPVEAVTAVSTRAVGTATRRLLSPDGKEALSLSIALMDRAEALFGIEGAWERLDETSAVKRVPTCPFADRLHRTHRFCTLIGGAMGREFVAALYPDREVVFEVRKTLSQGSPFCEYYLRVA